MRRVPWDRASWKLRSQCKNIKTLFYFQLTVPWCNGRIKHMIPVLRKTCWEYLAQNFAVLANLTEVFTMPALNNNQGKGNRFALNNKDGGKIHLVLIATKGETMAYFLKGFTPQQCWILRPEVVDSFSYNKIALAIQCVPKISIQKRFCKLDFCIFSDKWFIYVC